MTNYCYIWYNINPLDELTEDENDFIFNLLMDYSFPCYLRIPHSLTEEEKKHVLDNEYCFIQNKINNKYNYIKIMQVPRIIYDLLHIYFLFCFPKTKKHENKYDCSIGETYKFYCFKNEKYHTETKTNIIKLNNYIINLIFNNNITNFYDILNYIYKTNLKKITLKYNENFNLIRDYQEYFKTFIQIESEIKSGYFILYRGAEIKNDKLFDKNDSGTTLTSLSLNQSILNSLTTDLTACTFLYFNKTFGYNKTDRIKYIIKKHFYNDGSDESELFFIPPIHPFIQLLSSGELWHPRTKLGNIIEENSNIRSTSLACSINDIETGNILLSKNKSIKELQGIYNRFKTNDSINTFTKYFHNN
jgi:hypothetical protein